MFRGAIPEKTRSICLRDKDTSSARSYSRRTRILLLIRHTHTLTVFGRVRTRVTQWSIRRPSTPSVETLYVLRTGEKKKISVGTGFVQVRGPDRRFWDGLERFEWSLMGALKTQSRVSRVFVRTKAQNRVRGRKWSSQKGNGWRSDT